MFAINVTRNYGRLQRAIGIIFSPLFSPLHVYRFRFVKAEFSPVKLVRVVNVRAITRLGKMEPLQNLGRCAGNGRSDIVDR